MLGLRQTATVADLRKLRNNNVRLMYWHIFCFTIYQSICQWNLFDAYLSFLAKDKGFANPNTWVGFAEGIMGATTLVLALPLGLVADSFDRIKLLKVAGSIGVLATLISAYAFANDHLTTLYTNLFLWGLFTGLQGTAAEAVFADSIEKGKRSEKFTIKGMLNTSGLSLGPLLMLGLFLYIGDDWKLSQLHIPLLIGCCFAPLCCIPLFLMKDPQPNTVINQQGQLSLRTPLLSASRQTPRMTPASPMIPRDRIGSFCAEMETSPTLPDRVDSAAAMNELSAEDARFRMMSRAQRAVPYILTTADFITEVGAGMTVRFFPLFFIKDYGVTPIGLCAIFCVYPLSVAIAMPVCQILSKHIGRAQASFVFQSLGVLMLLLMTWIDWLPALIVVFLVRGQLQNAAYPVDRSVLMDYIPSKRRGVWNSIASLATMTWSGSAVLGGYLADSHDYRFTFLITAAIYAVGVAVYSPLLWLVPRREEEFVPMSIKKLQRSRIGTMDPVVESPGSANTRESQTPYVAMDDKKE